MKKVKQTILSLWVALLMVVQASPVAILAQETPPEQSTQTTEQADPATPPAPAPEPAVAPEPEPTPPPPPPETGPTKPPGPDSVEYTYNPETGKWESDKYIWDPATGQTQPKQDPGYYYNPETGRWDTNKWVYHPESGKYEQAPPSGGGPTMSAVGTSAADPFSKAMAALLGLPDPSNSNTGPGSSNSASSNTSNTGFFDLFSRAVVENNLNSNATTGDATVSRNTTGGNAVTGVASVVTNLVNLLNSAWSWASGGLNYFIQNLFGNHNGDIMLDPGTAPATGNGGQLGQLASNSNTGPDSRNDASSSLSNDFTVNNRSSGEITNNLDLTARSGNALVERNTTGGDALSGDAVIELNILNLINSAIASGQSFFGLINIFGNLNGDVLFPAGFLTGATNGGGTVGPAVASNSNTGPDSLNSANVDSSNNLTVNNSPTANFNNNLDLDANSGNASVTGNTTAGNATTGNATTNSNLYNLYNNSLFGDNAVLVLVNVLGTWVGGIMNLPTGSNSAMLTAGASVASNDQTGPNSINNAGVTSDNNLTLNNSPNMSINNNVNANATTGDATVTRNTRGGNATSGDASVAANIVNIMGSQLNLKNWFGVLVINVFGDWFGSVNKDTEAGNSSTAENRGGGDIVRAVNAEQNQSRGQSSVSGGRGSSDNSSNAVAQADDRSLVAAQGQSNGLLAAAVTDQAKAVANKATTVLFVLSGLALMMAAGMAVWERRTRKV